MTPKLKGTTKKKIHAARERCGRKRYFYGYYQQQYCCYYFIINQNKGSDVMGNTPTSYLAGPEVRI
jgi:hypothetical protein